jgi:hypothetical protein
MMGWKLMALEFPHLLRWKEDEDEEVEPVSNEDGEAIFDADSDDDA